MNEPSVLSKSKQVVVDLGLLITLIGFAWVAAGWKNNIERDMAEMRRDHEVVAARQAKYIVRRDEQHKEQGDAIQAERDKTEQLCQKLAALRGEVVC